MTDETHSRPTGDLDVQLQDLRTALAGLEAPIDRTPELRGALRARIAEHRDVAAPSADRAPTRWVGRVAGGAASRRSALGLAAAVGIGVAAALLMESPVRHVDSTDAGADAAATQRSRGSDSGRASGPDRAASTYAARVAGVPVVAVPAAYAPAASTQSGADRFMFQSVAYGTSARRSQQYWLVRVQVPVAALALDIVSTGEGDIGADALVGDDGMIAAIRFDEAPYSVAVR